MVKFPVDYNQIRQARDRIGSRVPIAQAEIELNLETRDEEHINKVIKLLSEKG